MKQFVQARDNKTADQLWVLEHHPVFTLGQAADSSHVLRKSAIPIVQSDRGGQVTYHGPGQIMFYSLVDIARLKVSVRNYVELLEKTVIDVLDRHGVVAVGDRDAPGVYVNGEKIAALGLRVRRGSTYHGLCFNYDFDATPFSDINPCGFSDMRVSQLSTLMAEQNTKLPNRSELVQDFLESFRACFGFTEIVHDRPRWADIQRMNSD